MPAIVNVFLSSFVIYTHGSNDMYALCCFSSFKQIVSLVLTRSYIPKRKGTCLHINRRIDGYADLHHANIGTMDKQIYDPRLMQ